MKIKFWEKEEKKVDVVQQPVEPTKSTTEDLIEADVRKLKEKLFTGRYETPHGCCYFTFGSGIASKIFGEELAKIYVKYGKEDAAKKIEAYVQKRYLEKEEFEPISYLRRHSSFKKEAEKAIVKVRDLEGKIREVAKKRDEEIREIGRKYAFHEIIPHIEYYNPALKIEHIVEHMGRYQMIFALEPKTMDGMVQEVVKKYDPEIIKLCEQREYEEKQVDIGYLEILRKVYGGECKKIKKDEYRKVTVIAKRLKWEKDVAEAAKKVKEFVSAFVDVSGEYKEAKEQK